MGKWARQGLVGALIKIQVDGQLQTAKRQDDLADEWVKMQTGKAGEIIAHVNTTVTALKVAKADIAELLSGIGADFALGWCQAWWRGMTEDVIIVGGSSHF